MSPKAQRIAALPQHSAESLRLSVEILPFRGAATPFLRQSLEGYGIGRPERLSLSALCGGEAANSWRNELQ